MEKEIIKENDDKAIDAVDEKEFKAAESQAKDAPGTVTIKLPKPFVYEGEEYKELKFEFDSLTGDDALNISDELVANGRTVIMPALSEHYLVRMAARACTKPVSHLMFAQMPLKYYVQIVGAARNFLLSAE